MENFKLLSERLTWAVARRATMEPKPPKISKRLIAEFAGVSPPAVNYWFADTNGIQAPAARKLAKFLMVDPVWLEKGEGVPERGPRYEVEDARPGAAVAGQNDVEAVASVADSLKVTCESASELQMLAVYRLTNGAGQELIDIAVEQARLLIDDRGLGNEG
jgi:transcriptional regulator with XRE-family HTH domain